MGNKKIYELAKEINKTNKETIEIANSLGIEAKSHLNSITDEEANKIIASLNKKEIKKETKDNSVNVEKTEKSEKNKKEEPVIIRRKVVVDENKKITKQLEEVGKITKNTQKEYNIVSRRPKRDTKPMTLNELLGLNNKTTQKESTTNTTTELSEQKENTKNDTNKNKMQEKNNMKKDNRDNRENKEKNTNNFQNQNTKDNKNNYNKDNRDNRENIDSRNRRNNGERENFKERNENNKFESRRRDKNSNTNFNSNSNSNNGKPNFRNDKDFDKDKRTRGREKESFKDNIEVDKGIERNKEEIRASKQRDKTREREKENRNSEDTKKKQRVNREEEFDVDDLKVFKGTGNISGMIESGDIFDIYQGRSKRTKPKKKDKEKKQVKEQAKHTEITIGDTIVVKDLAQELKVTVADVMKTLIKMGVMVSLNTDLDFDTAFLIASEYGINVNRKKVVSYEEILFDNTEDTKDELVERPPVVVVMGHVDHGKTSLLDAIRKTNKIAEEAGGITQHIGAYQVMVNNKLMTFLDTPGHEAFTSMRARGAKATDIAILVVAANDGVMPQTIEAINHAKAAEIPIIVAINKIDLPGANLDKIKQELSNYGIVPEEWGGDSILVPISAKENIGIDTLLEMVQLQADVLELKANPKKQAKGTVLEARLDKAKGPVVSMLVDRGTLNIGDTIIVGSAIGRIRNMINFKGERIREAGPSTPVEVTGLNIVPEAGEVFYEVSDEKTARKLVERRERTKREQKIGTTSAVKLEDLYANIAEGKIKKLNIVVKADVLGTAEAIKKSLENLSTDEVAIKVIHSSVGGVSESDVNLAKVAGALIIAFNVRPEPIAKLEADKDGIEIKQYSIIYNAIEDVKSAMIGMLDPEYEEIIIGTAEIRETFKISKVGVIAGAYVLNGKVTRNAGVRIIRDNVVLCDSKLSSLKRFKDDVKEVAHGYECGIQIEGFNDIQVGDTLEVYEMQEIKRKSLTK
jgi:translation initiation factor IF-2